MAVTLRPMLVEDLSRLGGGGGDGSFDDFGPRAAPSAVPGARLDEAGALAVLDDGVLAGDVSWHWEKHWGPTAGSRCPMIGIWLMETARGRGVGRRAQAAIVELLFAHTTAHRVEAATEVDNLAEQRALEAAGFTREGVVRGSIWRDGAYRDSVLYGVLRTDARDA